MCTLILHYEHVLLHIRVIVWGYWRKRNKGKPTKWLKRVRKKLVLDVRVRGGDGDRGQDQTQMNTMSVRL